MPQIVQYGLASIGALWLLYTAVRGWHNWVVASAIVRQAEMERAQVRDKFDGPVREPVALNEPKHPTDSKGYHLWKSTL